MAKPPTRAGLAQWLGVALIVLLLDQLSKLAVVTTLAYGSSHAVTGFLNLVLVYNPGAAFSLLAQAGGWQRWLFMGIGAAAAALMIRLLQRHPGKTLFCTAVALVLGGAIGNVIDRIVWGHVIDFIDVYLGGWHWPAFNLADSAITVGAVLLLVDELRRVQRH